MTISTIQNSFAGGEISPSLYGRTDLQKFHNAAFTMRNFFANYRGGASSRAGFRYVLASKQAASGSSYPPRVIPFQFNINQGYVLEFGDLYMRVIYNGAYVTETAQNITGITQANPGVFTVTAHGYSNGDWIYISSVGGMTEFNGLTWIVQNVTTNTFTVTDLFGNAIDTTAYTAYTSGGTTERIYTAVSPYAAADLPYLKYTQSADQMSLTCVNQSTNTEYPPYDLTRTTNTDWAFTETTFATSISPPVSISVTANASTTKTTYYSYVVTAIDSITGDESVASPTGTVENNDIAVYAGSNVITWSPVAGASSYNIYASTPSYSVTVPVGSQVGFLGQSFSNSFTDTNITPDYSRSPPLAQNPFARGAITAVNVTQTGATFAQSTIAYSITTSTGSGFVGIPIVDSAGHFAGMVIQNGGENYASTDTITITGGGVAATGTYTFTTNPTNGQTIILNGVTWTFVSSSPTGNETLIGANVNVTLTQLAADLNASTNSSLNPASYSYASSVITVTYKTTGTAGNAYTLAAGTYGGTVSGSTLSGGVNGSDLGARATLTVGKQTGTYPSVVAYFEQRKTFANTLNQPDTYFMSQPGSYKNFDASIPVVASDSITGAPWAQQINGIQFVIPMPNGLVILTGKGAWLLNGYNLQPISPSSQQALAQAYNGCNSTVPPVLINYDILFVQAKGSIIRDLTYNFFTNIYTGTDTTVLSNHLFNFFQMREMCYAEEPYKLLWVVRSDGQLLCLTYLKEQDVYAWSRHDTNGLFVSCCSVTEPPVDALYTVVKRYITGQSKWMYYIERMDNRNWIHAEDAFCVDSGLSTTMTYPDATLTPSAANGTSNITSVGVSYGGSGYTSPTVTAIDSTGQGSGATFSVTVSGGVITAVTPTATGQNYTAGKTTLVVTDSTGTGAILAPILTNIVTFTASSSVFTSANVGDVIRIGNNNASPTTQMVTNGIGQATITSYISGTQVDANVTIPITSTVPNDPNNTPIPAISGQWSLSTPTTTVSGLNHLEGMEVSILADGSVQPSATVTNGSITLPASYSLITVGLPYECQLQTTYLDTAGPTVQGKRKSIPRAVIRVEGTRGLEYGVNQIDESTQQATGAPEWTDMFPMKERSASIVAGNAIPLFTGDEFVHLPPDWSTNGQIAVQQTNPLPANVLAVISWATIGDSDDRS